MKQFILAFLFVLLQLCCKGQNLIFRHLMTKDGLSQNSIVAITQDSRGFMWYGSTNGLNRYDGFHFCVYKNNATDTTSLSDNYVRSLYSDSKGVLWVGTANGLNKFNPKQNCFKRIYLDKPGNTNQSNFIRTFYEDKEKHLWVGSNRGLYLLTDRATNTFTSAQRLGLPKDIANNRISSIYEDYKGYLWLGSNNGLIQLMFDKRIRVIKIFTKTDALTSISDNSVTAIVEDQQKNLWVATETRGLNLFDREKETFSRFLHEAGNKNSLAHNAVRAIMPYKSGELWIGTQEGLSILNTVTKEFSTYKYSGDNGQSLEQNSIYSLYKDLNGSVWIGTYYGGVNVTYAYPTSFHVWQYNEKLPGINANMVSSIIEDKEGNLWIGTDGGGLTYFNRITNKVKSYTFKADDPESLGSNLVKVVYRDKENKIWIGTHGGGLDLFEPSTGKFKRFLTNEKNGFDSSYSEISSLMEDINGILWTGGPNGLRLFQDDNAALKPYSGYDKIVTLTNKSITALFEDSKKNIWIGTSTGLYLYSEHLNALKSIKFNTNSITNVINCIQEDSKGNIWIGSDEGLAIYDGKQKAFTITYTTNDGLSSNNVAAIAEDRFHELWISTSNGLSKFDLQNKTFQTYTSSDGLAGDEFNNNSFFISKEGELFFGGFNGLTHFFPTEIHKNNYRAPIVFTGLRLFNIPVKINSPDHLLDQDISYTKKLTFGHDQNVITFEFALLNYIKSDKNKYAYKLAGINKQWIETKTPSIAYTNLPAGSYNLLIKGANNDGVWSKSANMQIEILPPFWATWWAFCFYTIILGTVLFFITKFFYLRQLLIKDEELHQVKLNFFTNVSHEIRTHLTLIMAPIEKLLDDNQSNETINRPLTNVKRNADRLLKLVSELMDFRKAESKNLKLHIDAHDLIDFIQNIYNSFEELSNKKKIQFSMVHDNAPIIVYFDKEQLEKVFFNLISNAFKFTPPGGSITINIEKYETLVKVSVADTGRGIAPEYLDNLFDNFFQVDDYDIQNTGYGIGLALSKSIIELHHGDIAVNSKPADNGQSGYTCFNVTLLLGTKHFKHTPYLHPIDKNQPQNNTKEKEAFENKELTAPENADHVKKYTILIVEDNAEICRQIADSLVNTYHILVAQNGIDGYNKAIDEIPDLIISDVMMPKMDGFTLCKQLKADERTSHIPVILLTAKSSEADQITGLTGRADIYLTKPFGIRILQLHVYNLLSAREILRKKFGKLMILEPKQVALDNVDEEFISKLIKIIEDSMNDEDFGVDTLPEKIGMSKTVLYKKLKAVTDMSVNDFSKFIRLKRAAQLLKAKRYTVYEVGYMVGFADSKYFSREFKKQFGKTPTGYMDNLEEC